ncbi:alpha/beta fold hydrolase [Acuticoccus sp. MNP-M23]|uniref:alpha/beta hydrolase n=1 Tax=Acuticoccus sp. MNP-M23 TaxID=3072793 RepID=UPI0028151B8A|nr:alpha/beta fold hydrolase [Acuticoccus sp. MNP-M23]WMS41984.1 alpha/beta fold hydrolase [Acuticoccus sp. MNP-M23]
MSEPLPRRPVRAAFTWLLAIVALAAIILSVVKLEEGRAGVQISELAIGTTPATLYRKGTTDGPLVIVAHGFAGSRQLMQAYSLTLAQSGYTVLAFDFEGHGRNPVPMSGNVDSIEGTTALLVAETRRVIAAGRQMTDPLRGVALLGHSMATDVIIRAALEEAAVGTPVRGVVAISMFSVAITATQPPALLAISGAWEGALRAAALDALHQVDPDAGEGETADAGGVVRRAVAAPSVEHVGVLYSATALRETRAWLDRVFDFQGTGPILQPGGWILLLLAGVVALLKPLTRLLPSRRAALAGISAGRFWLAVLVPAIAVPLVCTALYVRFLPVLVADYLMVHLAAYGVLQLLLLRVWRLGRPGFSWAGMLLLVVWGIAVFGLAMDRYVASYVPNIGRLAVMAALAVGTVPFMVADSILTESGEGRGWQRIVARVGLLASIAAAAMLDPERLMFLFIILPVLLLFFLVQGLMGRWVGQRSGPVTAGIGLGVCLAWALAVSFPQFQAG